LVKSTDFSENSRWESSDGKGTWTSITSTRKDGMLTVNLIRLFTFYLAAMFLLSMMRRYRQYQDVAGIVIGFPGRWPNVLKQMSHHHMVFMTWATIRPIMVGLTLLIIQWICSKVIWPQAAITLSEILEEIWFIPLILIAFVGMLGVDIYFLVRVGKLDRDETEKQLDQAEFWLTSWKAPIVKAVTFGWVNPRKMVDEEMEKAVVYGSVLVRWVFWWMSLQTGLRLLFGLSLWLAWAFYPESSQTDFPAIDSNDR
jgi:hypothetical protein